MLLMPDEIEKKKKEQQGLVDARTPEKAAESLLSPAMPLSPWEQMQEKHGTGGSILRMLGTGLSGGLLGGVLMPEMGVSGRAKYAQDLKDYTAEKKLARAQEAAQEYESLLYDDDPSNDMRALQMGAMHQPDVYGPVLRDRMQRDFNPAQETFTEGQYIENPNGDGWVYRMQGNQGTITDQAMPEGWIPPSRLPGAEYVDKSIGDADVRYRSAIDGASEVQGIMQQMDEIGPEGWASGLQGEASEFYKAVTGTEDFVSTVRKNYQDVKVRNGIKNLPPGVASDKDIELALSPWPEDTSDFNFIKRKLEAIERIERGKAEYALFESNYIAEHGRRNGLQNAWSQTEAARSVSAENKPKRTWTFED
jgi:hypothetical protein